MSERVLRFRRPVFEDGNFTGFHYWGYIDNSFVGPMDNYSGSKRGRSEQFTGLPDKNGKEIYHGDKLRDDQGYLFEVVYGELPLNKSGDCVCTYECFYAKELGKLGVAPFYDCQEIANWMEIIGNVHEESKDGKHD